MIGIKVISGFVMKFTLGPTCTVYPNIWDTLYIYYKVLTLRDTDLKYFDTDVSKSVSRKVNTL